MPRIKVIQGVFLTALFALSYYIISKSHLPRNEDINEVVADAKRETVINNNFVKGNLPANKVVNLTKISDNKGVNLAKNAEIETRQRKRQLVLRSECPRFLDKVINADKKVNNIDLGGYVKLSWWYHGQSDPRFKTCPINKVLNYGFNVTALVKFTEASGFNESLGTEQIIR